MQTLPEGTDLHEEHDKHDAAKKHGRLPATETIRITVTSRLEVLLRETSVCVHEERHKNFTGKQSLSEQVQ